jgi:hypothetical protein
MGDYKLDGIEGAGSHLAVDIKVPTGTPVYAIGNGVVVTVSTITTGFGTHIVVRHDNFPSFSNPNVLTTYYSSYNHLSSAMVSEGQVVLKGQQIGLSGETGDATTPHVHFQIDNDTAPWHPYWPFTYQEALAAGYPDMVAAINGGLGRDKALATTINPVVYIQKYLNSSGVSSSAGSSTTSTTTTTNTTTGTSGSSTTSTSTTASSSTTTTTTPSTTTTASISNGSTSTTTGSSTTTPPANDLQTPSVTVPATQQTQQAAVTTPPAQVSVNDPVVSLQVDTDKSFVVGVNQMVTVRALDAAGNVVAGYKPASGVGLQIENGGATLGQSWFSPNEITNGTVATTITPTSNLGLRIMANDGTITGSSDVLESALFTDVASSSDIYDAVQFLKTHNVIQGYSDGSFKPNDVVSRVEALKFILLGVDKKLQSAGHLPFTDTDSSQWYADYVATAFNDSIVSGYSDLTFRPTSTVNRVEFLKMLLLAMDVKVGSSVSADVYADVPATAWYAPYVQYAKDKNLIDVVGTSFNPTQGMTRGEIAEAIYRLIVIKISGQSSYSSGLTVTTSEADQYFTQQ